MIKISEKHNCNGCHACAEVCPKNCISMVADAEGFKYPKVDSELCVECGMCEKICPVLNGSQSNNTPAAYAAVNLNDEIRSQSSSGGIFYLLAEQVITCGGVVFGAKLDGRLKVVHGYAETIEEAKAFMGSKYAQSDVGDSYSRAKEFLKEGRLVLFTGTPCQIGGLKAFLGKEYENLICQDIICHGVPSPAVWEKYVAFRQSKAGSGAKYASFRDKKYGWKSFSMRLDFENGSVFEEKHKNDMFMKSFLRNFCLRPSCYHCAFKTKSRDADITLADFWGVQKVMPSMDDDKGTSLVILHTPKGKQLFASVKDSVKYELVDLDLAIQRNSAMIKSVPVNPQRDKFMSEIQKRSFDKVAGKYCKDKQSFVSRVKRKIKALCGKK